MIYRLLLLFTVLSFAQFGFANSSIDSLRTEKIKGKKYIIHRAEPKETLYSIAKRYDVSVSDLYMLNPSIKTNGLKMYDEISIPVLKKKKNKTQNAKLINAERFHIVESGQTLFAISKKYNLPVDSLIALNKLENANISIGDTLFIKPNTEKKQTVASQDIHQKIHIVQASETLFGISRLYQVEIEDIQRWNNLPDYTLSIGQELIVSNETKAVPLDSTAQTTLAKKEIEPKQAQPKKPVLDTLYVKTDNSQFKTKISELKGKKQTVEEGFAMKIEDTDYTKKFLALHRTAPLGSTIQVTNQMTNQIIDARVVGKLPESAMNRKLVMRLSSAAYKALGSRDLTTPVTVSFLEDE